MLPHFFPLLQLRVVHDHCQPVVKCRRAIDDLLPSDAKRNGRVVNELDRRFRRQLNSHSLGVFFFRQHVDFEMSFGRRSSLFIRRDNLRCPPRPCGINEVTIRNLIDEFSVVMSRSIEDDMSSRINGESNKGCRIIVGDNQRRSIVSVRLNSRMESRLHLE